MPPSETHAGVARGFLIYAQVAGWLMLASGAMASGLHLWAPARTIGAWPVLAATPLDTAVAFMLSGIALLQFLLRRGRWLGWCTVFSVLVLVSGVLALAGAREPAQEALPNVLEYTPIGAYLRWDGSMSALVGLGFVLLGADGLVACWSRGQIGGWIKDGVSILLLAAAMVGLAATGFKLGAVPEAVVGFAPMPFGTALLLLMAALAWMSAEPDRGMTRIATADSIGGALARRLLLPSLLLPLLFAYVMQLAQSRFAYSIGVTTSLAALFTGGAVATLTWWVATLMDRVERERRETQRMRDSAETDGLTGLPNRRVFDQAIQGLLRGRRERDTRFCLLMLDLDFFKSYNDSFGHPAGDDALRKSAQLLRDALRPSDLPVRYGGEEFAALLHDSDGEAGRLIAERIVERFRHANWPHRAVTISVGVAEAVAGDAAAALIARADAALYAAKHAGRNRALLAPLPAESAPGAAG
jgi:diguanylate cyclase (GGDEF)-like protein